MKLFVVLLLLLLLKLPVYADYVLPYPSFMPGHKLYTLSRILDDLKGYWFWGNIAQTKYHQGLSDKYLIEAKTLFEYRQYHLAIDALRRSDQHFQKGMPDVAREAHIAALVLLKAQLPQTYVWQDEHRPPATLELHTALRRSLEIRNE